MRAAILPLDRPDIAVLLDRARDIAGVARTQAQQTEAARAALPLLPSHGEGTTSTSPRRSLPVLAAGGH